MLSSQETDSGKFSTKLIQKMLEAKLFKIYLWRIKDCRGINNCFNILEVPNGASAGPPEDKDDECEIVPGSVFT